MTSGWQKIETAPKDGTEILVTGGTVDYTGHTYPTPEPFKGVTIARWYREQWTGDNAKEFDELYTHKPTHWMPLPPPHTEQET